MEFTCKNVRKRESINSVVGGLPLPESLQASSEADKRKFFEVCHDFLKQRYNFDISGAYLARGWHVHKKSLQSSMTKKEKQISFCQRTCSIERI